MKKNSAKLETILREQCLVYNIESERPKVNRLGDRKGRSKISALRATIYQTS